MDDTVSCSVQTCPTTQEGWPCKPRSSDVVNTAPFTCPRPTVAGRLTIPASSRAHRSGQVKSSAVGVSEGGEEGGGVGWGEGGAQSMPLAEGGGEAEAEGCSEGAWPGTQAPRPSRMELKVTAALAADAQTLLRTKAVGVAPRRSVTTTTAPSAKAGTVSFRDPPSPVMANSRGSGQAEVTWSCNVHTSPLLHPTLAAANGCSADDESTSAYRVLSLLKESGSDTLDT